jgi:hypothetical protein
VEFFFGGLLLLRHLGSGLLSFDYRWRQLYRIGFFAILLDLVVGFLIACDFVFGILEFLRFLTNEWRQPI